MPIKAFIESTDVSAYLKGLSVSPGGDGVVGDAMLQLDQQAGGLDLRPYMNVRIWLSFDAAGAGIAAKGRLFGGRVASRDTGNIGSTKTWALRCYDYNIILHKTVRDAQTAKSVVLSAGHFDAQMTQLLQIVQRNGFPSVNTDIDPSGVADLYATMPAVTYPGGKKLGWYISQLCNTAQALNTALIPHFYMGVLGTFGVAESFGNPVLYVYNGAALPAPLISFSDVVAGGRKGIYGKFRRTTDPTAMTQRQQAFFSDAHTVVTSQNASSQANYPWPYINHGGAANTGYIQDEVIEDRDSTTLAQAQAALDRKNAAKSNPVDTFEFETEERVLPGEMIGLGWALEGIPDDTAYRVAKVQMKIEPPEVVNTKLTVNSRRLSLFDDGTQVFAPPIEGDIVPPLPPTAFSISANFYDGTTGDSNMIFAIGASPSPDVVGYAIRGRVGHERVNADVETTLAPALIFPSGLAYDLQCMSYDRNRNYSEGFPVVSLAGTTAVPVYDDVPNKDLDVPDRVDATLHRWWTRTVANGGTATYNTFSNTGAGCVLLSTTSTIGSSASYTSSLTVAKGQVYATTFWARSNSGTPTLNVFYDWYDNTQAFLSSTTFSKTLTTSYARYTGTMIRPAGGAYFKVRYALTTSLQFVRVDTTDHQPQVPNDALEAITDSTKIDLWVDPATPRNIRDVTGILRGDESATPSTVRYRGINTGGSSPVSVNILSSTGDNLFVAGNGADTTLTSTTGVAVQSGAGGTASLVGNSGNNSYRAGPLGAIVHGAFGLESVITKTVSFTADTDGVVYLCNSASAITANLPTAVGITGRLYAIKNINTGVVTVDAFQQEQIDTAYVLRLSLKHSWCIVQSDGANWRVLSQGVGGVEWRPTTPSNLKLWTPTDVLAGNDGDAIGTLTDQSGNGFDLTQATGSLKPLLKTGANGQNGGKVLLFDGADDYMARTGLTALNSVGSFTIIIVFKTADVSSNHGILWKGGDGKFIQIFASNIYAGDGNTGYGHVAFTDTANYHVWSIEFDGSLTGDANRLKFYKDGAAQTLTYDVGIGTTTNATNGLWLGSNHNQAVFHQGQVADIAIWSAKLSSTDRGIAEQFMKDKWGTP